MKFYKKWEVGLVHVKPPEFADWYLSKRGPPSTELADRGLISRCWLEQPFIWVALSFLRKAGSPEGCCLEPLEAMLSLLKSLQTTFED